MWILGLGPIIAGLAMVLIVAVVLFAEVAGKAIVAAAQLTWEAVNPVNHRRAARSAG
jgi:hypothetical protein